MIKPQFYQRIFIKNLQAVPSHITYYQMLGGCHQKWPSYAGRGTATKKHPRTPWLSWVEVWWSVIIIVVWKFFFFYTVSCEWLIHRFRGSLFVQKGSYRDDPWIQWDHWMAEWGITGKKSLLDVPPESSPEWMSPECQDSSPDHRFKYCSFHVPLFQPEITITNGQIDRFVQWHGLMVWNQLNDIQCRFCSIEAITWSKEVASTCNIYPSIINVSLTTTKKTMANFRPHSWKCLRGNILKLFSTFWILWD